MRMSGKKAPAVRATPRSRTKREKLLITTQDTATNRHHAEDENPHGCIDGWVYLGFEGEDENGEHVEEVERVPCRRCQR